MKEKKRRQKIELMPDMDTSLVSIIKKAITVSPDTSILDARDILLKNRISRLVVAVKNKPTGIITEKDIARRFSVFEKKPIYNVRIKDVMSKNLITSRPNNTIYNCAKTMLDNKISSVVITDNSGLVGLITKTDLVSVFLQQGKAVLNSSDIMTKKVITASPNYSLFEVQSMLLHHKISRIIITKERKPIGIITHRDFVPSKSMTQFYQLTNQDEAADIRWSPNITEYNVNMPSYLLTFKAEDVMTKEPHIVYSNDPVYTAAILMIRNQISGLPVIKNNKQLAGIITKTDIVSVLASKAK